MKIKIVSDLHKEFEDAPHKVLNLDESDCDVLVLAGDTHTGTNGVEWAVKTFTKPVIYIHGNHEYYKNNFSTLVEANKAIANGTNVHVLENDAVEIDGVRFLGCTMWTDLDCTVIKSVQ